MERTREDTSGYHHELTEIEEHSKDQMLQQCKEAIEELNLQLAGQQEIQQALMEEKNRQYDDMSEEIAVLKEECEHLREEVHRKSQDLLCMEQVNTDLQKRHQIMQEFSATFEQVNTRIQETVRERDQLAEENESYKAQVEELTQTVIEKDRELERVIGELENLRRSNENGGQLQQSQNSRQQQLQSQQRQQQQIQQLQQQQQNNQQQQPSSSLGVLDGQYNSLDRNPMTHQVESRHTPYDDAQNSHNISNHNENSSTFQEVKSASFREQTHPEVSMTNLDGNNHMEDATGTNNNRNRSRSGRSNRSNHTHNINSNRHESPMHYPQGKSSQINGGNSVIDASNQQGEMDSNISRQFERMETALILRSSELAQREQQYEEALRELHSREDILQAREERYEREQQRQVIFLEQQQQKQRRELEQQSMQQQHRSNEESKQLKEAMYELSMQQTALSSAQNTIEAQSKETRKLASSNEQLRQQNEHLRGRLLAYQSELQELQQDMSKQIDSEDIKGRTLERKIQLQIVQMEECRLENEQFRKTQGSVILEKEKLKSERDDLKRLTVRLESKISVLEEQMYGIEEQKKQKNAAIMEGLEDRVEELLAINQEQAKSIKVKQQEIIDLKEALSRNECIRDTERQQNAAEIQAIRKQYDLSVQKILDGKDEAVDITSRTASKYSQQYLSPRDAELLLQANTAANNDNNSEYLSRRSCKGRNDGNSFIVNNSKSNSSGHWAPQSNQREYEQPQHEYASNNKIRSVLKRENGYVHQTFINKFKDVVGRIEDRLGQIQKEIS